MAQVRRALIVGGGIGGLAAAIAARRAGVEVDLVEIQRELRVYHVGIIVQGNFIRAMAALGIADEAVKVGFPQSGLMFQDLHGRVLQDIPGIALAGPQYPTDLGMGRPALHKVLTTAAGELGTNIRVGVTFTDFTQTDDHVEVKFTDGSSGRYDLLVGADGLHSKVRERLFGDSGKPRFTGQGVWRYNIARPPELTRAIMCIGLEGGKCGAIPLTPDTAYVLLVQAEPGNPRHPPEKLAEIFRSRLSACTGLMARMRDQIVEASQVVYRPLHAVNLPPPWYQGRVLLIGDAAHATTPHLGQGAAQAVEDAVVLGELLARGESPPQLMESQMKRRYERCRAIAEGSVQIGEWEQHPSPQADFMGLNRRIIQIVTAPI